MSAVIMHTSTSLYEFNDLNILKPGIMFEHSSSNLSSGGSASSSVDTNNSQTSILNNNNNNNNQSVASTAAAIKTLTNSSNQQLLQSILNGTQQLNNANNLLNLNQTTAKAVAAAAAAAAAATTPALLQQHLNALAAQQQDQQKLLLHNALSRAVSHPQRNNVTSLVNSLIENMNGHKKLERAQSEPLPQQVNTSRYKTELCRPFEEAGECKYGEKCQFAHGIHELRNLQRHPKYKTEYCRTFHSVGFCPYGPRCHFVHNLAEARIQQEEQRQRAAPQVQQRNNGMNSFNRFSANNTAAQHQNRVNAAALSNGSAGMNSQQQRSQSIYQNNVNQLPLSPPLSMSTGSDRASSTGSISPTNSVNNFQFGDQISPSNSSVYVAQQFSFNNTPPGTPHNGMSPISQTPSPPPTTTSSSSAAIVNGAAVAPSMQSISTNSQQNFVSNNNNNNSTCESISAANNSNNGCNLNDVNSNTSIEMARLPVFNRLGSSGIESFSELKI